MVHKKKNVYPERTKLLEQKVALWCMNNGFSLYSFLKAHRINPKTWYKLISGRVPLFTVVVKIVEGTKEFVTYEDFRNSLSEDDLKIDNNGLKE